ncbi:MAG: hypothetical protein AAF229_04665 [Pseudomonadota bacterium]
MAGLKRQTRRRALIALAALFPGAALAAPGDVLFTDNFERATLAPWTTNNTTRAGLATGGAVSNSGNTGLFTRHGPVEAQSPAFNAAVPAAELTIWVRRGSDAFSEDPDGGEDLLLEFRRIDGTWGALRTYSGAGTPGQVFNDSLLLPSDALHGSVALRLRQVGGSGVDFDYFHIDDVRVVERAAGNTLVVGTCDDFSSGLSTNWTISSGGGSAGTSAATFQSPSASLFTNGDPVDVISNLIDTTDPAFSALSLWIRRGADAFSENPDGVEDFLVEYLDDGGNWVLLEQFAGSGTPGEVFLRSYPMPANARHTGFRIRLRQLDGSGPTFDFWHADDVCLDTQALPDLRVSKVVTTLTDPVNGAADPYDIPGAEVAYTITVVNDGVGTVDAGSLIITDVVPDDVALRITPAPTVAFADGAVASGVSLIPANVSFSNQPGGGAPFDYTPTPDGTGVDASVTGVRIELTGAMNANSGSGSPSFTLTFNAIVR